MMETDSKFLEYLKNIEPVMLSDHDLLHQFWSYYICNQMFEDSPLEKIFAHIKALMQERT